MKLFENKESTIKHDKKI